MYMYYVQRYDEGVVCNEEKLRENVKALENGDTAIFHDVCVCDSSEQDNFCSYRDSLQNVFGYMAGGPDDTTDFLDFICGFVVVIIFLNVVIAIVSNAW